MTAGENENEKRGGCGWRSLTHRGVFRLSLRLPSLSSPYLSTKDERRDRTSSIIYPPRFYRELRTAKILHNYVQRSKYTKYKEEKLNGDIEIY